MRMKPTHTHDNAPPHELGPNRHAKASGRQELADDVPPSKANVVDHHRDVRQERDGHPERHGSVQAAEAVGSKERIQSHAVLKSHTHHRGKGVEMRCEHSSLKDCWESPSSAQA